MATALLTVRNKHGAIDETELPRLFDRFYRGRDAAVLASAGSGLGLAIARWMVEKQGGTIALEREGAEGDQGDDRDFRLPHSLARTADRS